MSFPTYREIWKRLYDTTQTFLTKAKGVTLSIDSQPHSGAPEEQIRQHTCPPLDLTVPPDFLDFLHGLELPPIALRAALMRVHQAVDEQKALHETKYQDVCAKFIQLYEPSTSSKHSSYYQSIKKSHENSFQRQLVRIQETLAKVYEDVRVKASSGTKKPVFNSEYTPVLAQYFEYNAFPSARDRELLARKSSMTARQIEVWFQNHRRRARQEGRILKRITTDPLPAEVSMAILKDQMPSFMIRKEERPSPSVDEKDIPSLSIDRLPSPAPSPTRDINIHTFSLDDIPTQPTARSARYTPRDGATLFSTPRTSTFEEPVWYRKASIVMKQTELPDEQHPDAEVALKNVGKRKRTLSDTGITRFPPPREALSQPSTCSNPPPLIVSDILDQAMFSSPLVTAPSNTEATSAPTITPPGSYNPYNAFAAFFATWTGTGSDAFTSTSPQTLNQLPLLNLVDDVPPANVHVEYDQSWSLDYCADELAPSIDTSITGYNWDDFGSNLHTDLTGGTTQQWGPFWLAAPPQDPYPSDSPSGSHATSLSLPAQLNPPAPSTTSGRSPPAHQLYLSTPSPTSPYHCLDIPAKGERQPFPLSNFPSPKINGQLQGITEKAKELMELEARCAALRNELATAC